MPTDEPRFAQAGLVVVGAGMAGLVAAVEAAERDADVLVVEKGPHPGGSMAMADGFLWTHASVERAREVAPDGDPDLQRLVIDGIETGYEWLEEHDIPLETPPFETPDGRLVDPPMEGQCRRFDPDALVDAFVGRLNDLGCALLLETPMTGLLTDDAGRVTGISAHEPDGPLRIDADATILATGGFQGNETLLQAFVTEHTEHLWLRANPWSTGDGLLAALDVGGTSTGGMGTFYGHTMPAPPASLAPDEFVNASQYYGSHAVALGRDGRRFTDESALPFEYSLAQDVATQGDGQAVLVIDADLYDADIIGSVAQRLERARDEYGARVGEASAHEELADLLWEWGYDGDRGVQELDAFNDAVMADGPAPPSPPRRRHRKPVDTPPFYAIEVQAGITFTMGGIAVTDRMAVVRRVRSSSPLSDRVAYEETGRVGTVDGLYAAGVDVGNVSRRGYVGGLAQALVTGLVAAGSATGALHGG